MDHIKRPGCYLVGGDDQQDHPKQETASKHVKQQFVFFVKMGHTKPLFH